MGGSKKRRMDKERVCALCPSCHDKMHSHEWGCSINHIPGKGLVFWAWDLHGKTIAERVLEVGSAAVEAREGRRDTVASHVTSTAPPPTSGGTGEASEVRVQHSSSASPRPSPDLEGVAVSSRVLSVPPVTTEPPTAAPSILNEDWSALSDEELETKFYTADQMQAMSFLVKCKVVHAYRENHVRVWGASWTDQAIERFGVSRPYAKAYANLYEIWVKSDAHLREGLSMLTDSSSLMQMIGRKAPEEGVKLLEAAVAHVAEFAQPPSIATLAGDGKPKVQRWSFDELEGHLCLTCQREVLRLMEQA